MKGLILIMKINLKIKNPVKHRNYLAKELWTSGLFKQKVIKSKKVYNRKKMKLIKEEYVY